MLEDLKPILQIQELDMKIIRLMLLKRERTAELKNIHIIRNDLLTQLMEKKEHISQLTATILEHEAKIEHNKEELKRLEGKQSSVKKVDEFNALTREMSNVERERVALEQATSDLIDKRGVEEEILHKIEESLKASEESSRALEEEIGHAIRLINQEGRQLQSQREVLTKTTNPDILKIYNRLMENKRDQVVVPIENRSCSGCHISLTAQHENQVRRGDRLIFCEHCSRIHYWQDIDLIEGEGSMLKKRRRRTAAAG